jgi:hypothetical protein
LIQIDRQYWDLLDITNKAALIYHEWIYMFRRSMDNETVSDNTRAFIGRLFSMNQLTPKYFDMPSNGYTLCRGHNHAPVIFYFYQSNVDHRNVITFQQILAPDGQPWRVTFDPGPFVNLLNNPKFSSRGPLISEIGSEQNNINLFRNSLNSKIQIEVSDKSGQLLTTDTLDCSVVP